MNIISAYFGRYNLQVATMLRCNEHVDRVTQELNEAKDESEVEQQRCALYFNSGLTHFQTATLTSSCSLLGWSSFSVPSRSYGSNLQNSHQPFMFTVIIVELNQNISQLQWNKIVLSGALKLLSNPYFRTKWPAEVVKPAAGLLLNDARGFDCRSNFQVDLIDCVCLSLLDHF